MSAPQDAAMMQRLLSIAEQLSTALETNRERIQNVNNQTEQLKRALQAQSRSASPSVAEKSAVQPLATKEDKRKDEQGYIKPDDLPAPSSPAYLQKLELAHAALLEDHELAMQTVHVLMAKIRSQDVDVERRVGIIHREVLNWKSSAEDLLHAQMTEHTALSKQVNTLVGAIREVSNSAESDAAFQSYVGQLATENASYRAMLSGGKVAAP